MYNEPIKLLVGQKKVLQMAASLSGPPQSSFCLVEQLLVLILIPPAHDVLHSVHPPQLLHEGTVSWGPYMFTKVSYFSSVLKLK